MRKKRGRSSMENQLRPLFLLKPFTRSWPGCSPFAAFIPKRLSVSYGYCGQCFLEFLDRLRIDSRRGQVQHAEVGQPFQVVQAFTLDFSPRKVQPVKVL